MDWILSPARDRAPCQMDALPPDAVDRHDCGQLPSTGPGMLRGLKSSSELPPFSWPRSDRASLCQSASACFIPLVLLVGLLGVAHSDRASAAQFKIERTDGSVIEAAIDRIADGQLEMRVDGRPVRLPTGEVRRVKGTSLKSLLDGAVAIVSLIDGTEFPARELKLSGDGFDLKLADGAPVRIPPSHVRWVQFGKLSERQQRSWKAIRDSASEADVLAVRRDDDTLATIGGLVGSIDTTQLMFSIDGGQEIPVALTKLGGVQFYAASRPALEAPSAIVLDASGGRWEAAAVSSSDGQVLQIRLRCGTEVQLAMEQVSEIDFSPGTLKYLSELEPLDFEGDSAFGFERKTETARGWFGPRIIPSADSAFSGGDLEFLGRSQVAYRLPSGFAKLVATAELRPSGEHFTPCALRVWVDNEVVWEGVLTRPRERLQIDAPVRDDARLRLVVEPQASLPVGACVVLHQPRLMR